MFRLLFWIALIAIAVWFWRRTNKAAAKTQRHPERAQVMVRCARCDLHVLQDEALERDGNWYCSADHQQQGPRQLDQ